MRLLRIHISVPAFLAILLVFLWTLAETDAAVPDETIRIAIVKNSPNVTVDGDGLLATRENGEPVLFRTPVQITAGKDGLLVNGTGYRQLTFAASSAVIVNGKPYRGAAEILFADKGLLVVNSLPLEDYLVGLINCEISSAWPIESVKAQAVIARSYALTRKEARKNAPYHLESSVIDQVYEGCLLEDSRAKRAVSETTGEVLVYNQKIIQAFYHSHCGGKTEASNNVWGASLPYLQGVDCEYCLTAVSTSWEQKLKLKDLEERFRTAGLNVMGVSDIKGDSRNNRGRWKNIIISSSRGEVSVTGDQFRKAVGYGIIKSTNFVVKISNGEAIFSGTGNGHGVGLCQWGAKQRALDGFEYTEILSYYYPGTELKKLSEVR